MKKLIAVGVAVLLALPLAGGVAQAGKKKKPAKPVQVVDGSIALPAPFPQSATAGEPFDGCWGGATRRTTGQTTGAVNGVTGYYFDIDPKSWNKPFKLEPTGGEGTVDLDVFMYIHYPGLEETPDDPVNGGAATSIDFQNREEGGETGTVPPQATKAIVCLYGGPAYYGYNATFNYAAG
jgi:hypothetical protein